MQELTGYVGCLHGRAEGQGLTSQTSLPFPRSLQKQQTSSTVNPRSGGKEAQKSELRI